MGAPLTNETQAGSSLCPPPSRIDNMEFEYYYTDDLNALDARAKAQEICFAPYTFQAAYALTKMGLLKLIADSLEGGIDLDTLSEKSGVSLYGCGVLCEMGLAVGLIKLAKGSAGKDRRFTLGKTGYFFLEDGLTIANLDFMQDICYEGANKLVDSIERGKPVGLKAFGDKWNTIYEALSSLPAQEQKSWFAFDHYYSDHIMPDALPIVFQKPVARLFDIGGNTAKWALKCCNYNPDVKVTIVDLPGQVEMAKANVKRAGFENRVDYAPCNVLDDATTFPQGANVVWMSQFLDCFSLDEITKIIRKITASAAKDTRIFVLEPLLDQQKYRALSFSLQATSLYFTTMANGNSRMYNYHDIVGAIEKGGVHLSCCHHNLGVFSYSLMEFMPNT